VQGESYDLAYLSFNPEPPAVASGSVGQASSSRKTQILITCGLRPTEVVSSAWALLVGGPFETASPLTGHQRQVLAA